MPMISLFFNQDSYTQQTLLKEQDADRLIRMAVKEGLAGILYKNLLRTGHFNALNRGQQQKLHAAYHRTLLQNLKLHHNLKKILSKLNQNGIEVVLLQGMDLLHTAYVDMGLRPLSDIDLWVLPKDYGRMADGLTSQNFRRDPLYPHTFRKGSTVLDIHTHILWADRIRSRRLLLKKSQDDIYRKTRLISFDGEPVRCLGRYDQVLYLGLHLLKHNAGRLIWLVDVKTLVAEWKLSDWQALLLRARELGQGKCIAYTLFLMERLLHFHLPKDIRPQLAPLNPVERKILRLRQKKESLPEWSILILYSSGLGLFKAAAFILETLFPRPEILRQVFAETPGLSVSRLYTRRIFQLIKAVKSSDSVDTL